MPGVSRDFFCLLAPRTLALGEQRRRRRARRRRPTRQGAPAGRPESRDPRRCVTPFGSDRTAAVRTSPRRRRSPRHQIADGGNRRDHCGHGPPAPANAATAVSSPLTAHSADVWRRRRAAPAALPTGPGHQVRTGTRWSPRSPGRHMYTAHRPGSTTTWPTCPALPGARHTVRRRAPVRRRCLSDDHPQHERSAPAGPELGAHPAPCIPSPPSRTGTPGTAAATRSTIGKSRHAGMLMGLIVPVGRWIRTRRRDAADPSPPTASAMACRRRPRPDRDRRHAGSISFLTEQPPGFVDHAGGDLAVPPMSTASIGSISADGCCRAGVGRRDARSRGRARRARRGAGPAISGTLAGAAQMLRQESRCRKPSGVPTLVIDDCADVDVDGVGDVCEHGPTDWREPPRPRCRFQARGGVRQPLSQTGGLGDADAQGLRLVSHHPLTHQSWVSHRLS